MIEQDLLHQQADPERRLLLLQAVYQVAEKANQSSDPTRVFDAALEALTTALSATRAAVLVLDRDGVMRFQAFLGLSERYRLAVEGHNPWAVDDQHPQPVVIGDALIDPSLAALRHVILEEGVRALAFIPLVHRGRLLGKFMLYYDAPHTCTDEEIAVAQAVASHVSAVIDRHEAEREIRFQRALLESQSEATIDGILVVSSDGRIISFNRRFVEMWNIPDDVITSRSDDAALHFVLDKIRDPQEFMDRVRYLYENTAERSRDEISLKDGRVFDRWSAPLTAPDGTYQGRAWYFRDVTDRIRYEEALRRSEERLMLLSSVAPRLLEVSLDYSSVLERVAEIVVPALADYCAVREVAEDGVTRRLAIRHADSEKRDLVHRLDSYSMAPTDEMIAEVVRTQRSVLLEKITPQLIEEAAANDEHLGLMRAFKPVSAMVVPVHARGRIVGLLKLVSCTPGRHYDHRDVAMVEDLAHKVGLILDNTRAYEERSRLADTLQKSLLPHVLPDVSGLELAALYIAASGEIGGDFYDVFPLGRKRWLIAVGDVCGKGPEAAALTSMARYTLRAAATHEDRPSNILGIVNAALLPQVGTFRFCTLACAVVRMRQASAHVTACSAGHPLPLVLRRSGDVETLGRPGHLLGVFPDVELYDVETVLGRGDALVMFTDGATDEPDEPGVTAESRLASALAACKGGSPARLVRAIADAGEANRRPGHNDDTAILVAKMAQEL